MVNSIFGGTFKIVNSIERHTERHSGKVKRGGRVCTGMMWFHFTIYGTSFFSRSFALSFFLFQSIFFTCYLVMLVPSERSIISWIQSGKWRCTRRRRRKEKPRDNFSWEWIDGDSIHPEKKNTKFLKLRSVCVCLHGKIAWIALHLIFDGTFSYSFFYFFRTFVAVCSVFYLPNDVHFEFSQVYSIQFEYYIGVWMYQFYWKMHFDPANGSIAFPYMQPISKSHTHISTLARAYIRKWVSDCVSKLKMVLQTSLFFFEIVGQCHPMHCTCTCVCVENAFKSCTCSCLSFVLQIPEM